MGNQFYVYEHWRPDTDLCFYVGKGMGQRAYVRKRNRHHESIAQKLSAMGMCVEVRMVASGLDEATSFVIEKDRIAFWRSAGVTLTNQTEGGDGQSGFKLSVEHREKIAAAHRGKKHPPEFGAKVSAALKGRPSKRKGIPVGLERMAPLIAANKGRPLSPEHRQKLSAIGNGRRHTPEHCNKISQALLGRKPGPRDPESIAKTAASNRGKKRSPETRARIAAAQIGRPVSQETRAKISASLKARSKPPVLV